MIAKVFISLLMQMGIAIAVFLALVGLDVWPLRKEKKQSHTHALATALFEFHRNQCYFISAVVIASLVLEGQASKAFRSDEPPPLFDVLLSIPLALNGLVPVVFTLSYISRYGRLSWYIITLSVITVALSTGSLASSYRSILSIRHVVALEEISGNNIGGDHQEPITLAQWICGSKASNLGALCIRNGIRFAYVWLIYTNCIIWTLWYLIKHSFSDPPIGSLQERIVENLENLACNTTANRVLKRILPWLGYSLFILTWLLCFIYHFYLYSLFTRFKMVSPSWTLGQIIAVTVWVPSIVEFFYIEYSQYLSTASSVAS